MGGGLESRCVGRVYGADGARHHPHRTHDFSLYFMRKTDGQTTLKFRNCLKTPLSLHARIGFDAIICNFRAFFMETQSFMKLFECKIQNASNVSIKKNIEGVSYEVHSAFIYRLFHATYCPYSPPTRIVTSKPNGIFKLFLILVELNDISGLC